MSFLKIFISQICKVVFADKSVACYFYTFGFPSLYINLVKAY